jgi:hypothetical protein
VRATAVTTGCPASGILLVLRRWRYPVTAAVDDATVRGLRALPHEPLADPVERLKASLKELLRTLLRRAVGVALDQVEHLAKSFDAMAASGGFALSGVLGGIQARLAGKNPVWGAVKAAVGSLSPEVRVLLVLALVLALVLLPVTVVLLLIALIVVIIVVAAKS